ncbi:MAG: tetratricopeptide repeat protein [Pirellulaceae bacterium]|nr:tetratricopeptide repeat protein [Pirellulaceae bacterium]
MSPDNAIGYLLPSSAVTASMLESRCWNHEVKLHIQTFIQGRQMATLSGFVSARGGCSSLRALPALLLISMCAAAGRAETKSIPAYVQPNFRSILTVRENADGTNVHAVDMKALDTVINGIRRHAGGYPPRFANKADQELARRDCQKLAKMMDVMVGDRSNDPGMLYRAALTHSMAHHLDVKTAAKKADAYYERLLDLNNDDVQGQLQYGLFLADSSRTKSAIVHLQKAMQLGADADVALAVAHVADQNLAEAKRILDDYVAKNPDDERAQKILWAVNAGRVKVKKTDLGAVESK